MNPAVLTLASLFLAQAQMPDATLSGAEFMLLQPKNSVPMWRVTLWGKSGTSDEQKLGEFTLLAETGTVIRNVKPATATDGGGGTPEGGKVTDAGGTDAKAD